MIYKQLTLCILLFTPILLVSQDFRDERILIEGSIYSALDSIELDDIHVINMTSEKVTASFNDGYFIIPVTKGDQLLFSGIGYRLSEVIITDSMIENNVYIMVHIPQQIYLLESVNVWPYQTFAEFKQAFIDLQLEDETLDMHLPATIRYQDFQPGELGKVTIAGPITALYNVFSKEGKSKRKYMRIVQEADYQKYIATKYNEDIVQTVTGIDDKIELKKFMEYCKLSEEFIINSIDYKIYLAIKECYLVYANLH